MKYISHTVFVYEIDKLLYAYGECYKPVNT